MEAYLRSQEEQRLFDSYTLLGEDLTGCDVEYAWDAQREAVDRASPMNRADETVKRAGPARRRKVDSG